MNKARYFEVFEAVKKYFEKKFAHRKLGDIRHIGRELELTAVAEDGKGGWLPVKAEYAFEFLPRRRFNLVKPMVWEDSVTGCLAMTDASETSLELVFRPVKNLGIHFDQFREIMSIMIDSYAQVPGCGRLLGLGTDILNKPSRNLWLKCRPRYKGICDYHDQFPPKPDNKFAKVVEHISSLVEPYWDMSTMSIDSATVSFSDQLHVDVTLDEVPGAMLTTQALSGFLLRMFGNGSIVNGQNTGWNSYREAMWYFSPYCTGVPYEKMETFDQLLEDFLFMPVLTEVLSDGSMVVSNLSLFDVIQNFDQDSQEFEFKIKDQQSRVWYVSRYKECGAIEVRPIGCQPPSDWRFAPLIQLGIVQAYKEIWDIINNQEWEYWVRDRFLACWQSMERMTDSEYGDWSVFAQFVLEAVETGLKKRGFEEEKYVGLLYERLKSRRSPSDIANEIFAKEGLDGLIDNHTYRKEHLWP